MLKRRFTIFLVIGALLTSFFAGPVFVTSSSVSAQVGTGAATPGNSNSGGGPTTCAVEGIGWLICMIMRALAKLNQAAWELIKALMVVDRNLFDDDSGTYEAWKMMRDFANLLFGVLFFFLIYSQITGVGAGSYGWKRMLPRLILAAILVNTSYFLCQIIVDFSNIVGSALKDLLDTIAATQYSKANNQFASAFESGNTLPLQALAFLILGSAAVWILLPILGTVVMGLLVTLLMTLLILVMRKALIVLLIFIAPLAFVAYLLPNTEKWFKKWFSAFINICFLYIYVALAIGAGNVASSVLLTAQYDMPQPKDPATVSTAEGNAMDSTKQGDAFLALTAMGTQALILAIIPMIVSASTKGLGAIGGVINSFEKGTRGRAGGIGQRWNDNNTLNRSRAIRRQAKQNYKTQKYADRLGGSGFRGSYTRFASRGVAGNANAALGKVSDGRMSLGGGIKAQQAALGRAARAQTTDAEQKEISGAQAELQAITGGDMDEIAKKLKEAIERGNEIQAKAAENMLMGMGGSGVDAFAKAIQDVETAKNRDIITKLKQHTAQHHGGIKEKSGDINKWMTDKEYGVDPDGVDHSLAARSRSASSFSGLSDDQIAGQSHAALHAAFNANAINGADASRILKSSSAQKLGGDQRKMLQELADAHFMQTGETPQQIAARHAPTETNRLT